MILITCNRRWGRGERLEDALRNLKYQGHKGPKKYRALFYWSDDPEIYAAIDGTLAVSVNAKVIELGEMFI